MNPRGDVNTPQGEVNYSLFHYFGKTRKTTIYSVYPKPLQLELIITTY